MGCSCMRAPLHISRCTAAMIHTHTQLTKAKTNFTEPEAMPANLGKGWGTCLPGTPTAPWHGLAQGQIDTHMVTELHVFGQLGKLVFRASARKTSLRDKENKLTARKGVHAQHRCGQRPQPSTALHAQDGSSCND